MSQLGRFVSIVPSISLRDESITPARMPTLGLTVMLIACVAQAATADTHSLLVLLRSASDETPVRGVRVRVGDYAALSDYTGTARFAYMEQPPQRVTVRDLDYHFVDHELTEAEAGSLVTLELEPMAQADVTVTVSLQDAAEPVVGARVVFERVSPAYLPVSVEAWAGLDGTFRVRGLPIGEYEVRAAAAGCRDYVATVTVTEGQSTLDVQLAADTGRATVAGSVQDAWTGQPIAGADVSAVHTSQGKDLQALAATKSNADGAFTLADVPLGLRQIAAAEPIRPVTRRFVIRVHRTGYLDGFFPVELDGRGTGRLRARLWPDSGVVPEREPNNDFDAAQRVPPTVTLQLAISLKIDKDFFRFFLPTDGLLRVHVAENPIELHLSLHEPRHRRQIAWRGIRANTACDWETGLRAGEYIMCVQHWGNSRAMPDPFELPMEFLPAADAHERNDASASAALLTLGERFYGFLFPTGDADWFRFRVARPGTGLFTTSALPISTHVRIFDDAGKQLAWRGVTADKPNSCEFTLSSPGAYYIEAEHWDRSEQTLTPYESALDFVPGDAHEDDGRHERLTDAVAIEIDAIISGTLNPLGDRDWFRVDVPESGVLHVRVSALPIKTWVQVTDAVGKQLSWRGVQPEHPNELLVSLPRRGTYYVQMEHWGLAAWSASPYLLRTAFYPNDPRDRRDNGEPTAATPISPASIVDGQLGFVPDRDFYRVFIPRRGVLRSQVSSTSIKRFARVLSPDAKQLVWRGVAAGRPLDIIAQVRTPGWQTVHVEHWGNRGWTREPYRLEHVIQLEDPLEPNDEPMAATQLPARMSLAGSLLPLGDRDCFRIYADRKDRYRVTVTALDIKLAGYVFDAQGKQITWRGVAANTGLVMEWDAPAPGLYRIQLEHWDRTHWSAKHYSIYIGRASEPAPPIARLTATQNAPSRRTVTFVPAATAAVPAASYEIDFDGNGVFDWQSPRPETVQHTYDNARWVTAVLQVRDASGAVGTDYATFSTHDPGDDRGLQIEFIQPLPGQIVDGPFDVELLAWRPDGRPVRDLRLDVDGQEVARWVAEPCRTQLKPDAWAGRDVLLTAVADGDHDSRAELPLKVTPLVNLLPPPDALLTSPEITFQWNTAESASSEVRVRGPDGSERAFTGQAGHQHRVEARDLERDREYTWVARSGKQESRPRRFRLVRGIEFAERVYKFAIERDYDQRGTIRVVNHNETPEKLRLHVDSEHGDLLTSFVGEGSPDKIIELAPGEQRDVLLAFSAQDTLHEHHTLPITLESIAGEFRQVHTDVAQAEVTVRMPRVEFSAEIVGRDSGTLACQIEVHNRGDKLTDFSAHLDEATGQRAYVSPAIEHAELRSGEKIRFRAIPVLQEQFESFESELVMRAVHVEQRLPLSFTLPAGKRVFLASVDVSTQSASKGRYCTNAPSIRTSLTVPPGAQRGSAVGVQPPRLGMRELMGDLAAFHEAMRRWIDKWALNHEQRAAMHLLLDMYVYQADGKWQGDPEAALREIVSYYRGSNFAELSLWERQLAETDYRDKEDGFLKDHNSEKLEAWVSYFADLATLISSAPGVDQATKTELAVLLEDITRMREAMHGSELRSLEDMKRHCEFLKSLKERSAKLLEAARRVCPHPESRVLQETLLFSKQIAKRFENATKAVEKLTNFSKKVRRYFMGTVSAEAATAGGLPSVRVGEKLVLGARVFGVLLSSATFVSGAHNRYEALRLREGISDDEAFTTAVTQALLYTGATMTGVGAVADLVTTIGFVGAEQTGLVKNATERDLRHQIDIVGELGLHVHQQLMHYSGASAPFSLQRLRDIRDRLTELGGRAAANGASYDEAEHWIRMIDRVNLLIEQKEGSQ